MAARTTMSKLIARFRLLRADITSTVMSDEEVEQLFDLNRFRLNRVLLQVDDQRRVYQVPVKFLEDGFTIITSGNSTVTPNNLFPIEGIVMFDAAQSGSLFIRGWAHNLYYTLAISLRAIAADDDRWSEITRGRVTLKRQDFLKAADRYEAMGFIPNPVELQRA